MISAISVKDRLKNQAVANGKTFQEALTTLLLPIVDSITDDQEYAAKWDHEFRSWKQKTIS